MSSKKCLYPGCERESRARGLCNPHYTAACFLVKRGKTSWEELETKGKSLPSRIAGNRWFLEEKA
jgi:hypothetical protein